MDSNNWRQPYQTENPIPSMDGACGDWRSQLQADSRPRVVDKIMDTLRHHVPSSRHDAVQELKNFAMRFEENAYHAAIDQFDYLRRISLEMLMIESKNNPPDPILNAMPSNSAGMSGNSQDPASQSMQPQVQNQGQSLSILMASNQSAAQGRPQLLTQNIQININNAGVHSSTTASQPHMQQQTQQNNLLSSSQSSFQQHQHSSLPSMHQQQMNSQTLIAGMLPQQQQMLVSQSDLLDSTAQTGNFDTQEEVYQKLEVMKDLYFVEMHAIYQKVCLRLQQHETSLSQQAKSEAFERLTVYKHGIERILQVLQLSRSNAQHFHKDRLPSLEKQILQILSIHDRPRKPGSNLDPGQGNAVASIQQNPVSAPQQTNPQTGVNLLRPSMDAQQPPSNMLQSQHLKQQQEQQLKQLFPNGCLAMHQPLLHNWQQVQQPGRMQGHQMTQLHQMKDVNDIILRQGVALNSSRLAPFPMPGDPAKASSATSNAASIIQQQTLNTPASLDSTAQTGNSDAQEEVYQKLKVMKDLYFAEINEIHHKICLKLQRHETSLSQPAKLEAFERLKVYKQIIERILQILQLSESDAQHFHKDKLPSLEKQILQILNTHRPKRPGSNLDPGQGNAVGYIQQNGQLHED